MHACVKRAPFPVPVMRQDDFSDGKAVQTYGKEASSRPSMRRVGLRVAYDYACKYHVVVGIMYLYA